KYEAFAADQICLDYPKTGLSVGASSKELRQKYLEARRARDDCPYGAQHMQELETLADPVKRAIYDEQLGFRSLVAKPIAGHDDSEFLKYGAFVIGLFFLMGMGISIARLYGCLFESDFKELAFARNGDEGVYYESEFSPSGSFSQMVLNYRWITLFVPSQP